MDRSAVAENGGVRGGLPLVRALLVAALLLLIPSPVAATDLAIVPTLRDPGTPVSGTIGLQPTLRDGGPALPSVPTDAGVGRPAPGPGWTWQTYGNAFSHDADFNASVASGQEDAAVEYDDQPDRRAYVEGSYLTWTADRIAWMQSYGACIYQTCANYSLVAAVFHAFAKNTNTPNALKEDGWFATNFPGAYFDSPHDDEVRVYISDPNMMQPEPTMYYAQTYYKDTAYPATKTTGELDYSTYLVSFVNPMLPYPTYRDFNRKVCVNPDSAGGTNQSGACP